MVAKGVYRISRHALYFGQFLLYVGMGMACASWVILLFAVAWIVLWHLVLPPEECLCLENYGNAYYEYMDRTLRWIGIPKSGEK